MHLHAWLCLCRIQIEMPCNNDHTRTPHDLACYIVLRSPHAFRIEEHNLIRFYNWSGAYQPGSNSVETETPRLLVHGIPILIELLKEKDVLPVSRAGGKLDSPRHL